MQYRIIENGLGNFVVQSCFDLSSPIWRHNGEFQNLKEARAHRDKLVVHEKHQEKVNEVKRVIE